MCFHSDQRCNSAGNTAGQRDASMFQFNCPHCKAEIRIDEKHRGKKGRCKSCGKELRIPVAVEEADEFLKTCLLDSCNTTDDTGNIIVNVRATSATSTPAAGGIQAKKQPGASGWGGLIVLLIIVMTSVSVFFYFDGASQQQGQKMLVDVSPAMQAKRLQLIEQMRQNNIIQKIDIPGTIPHVWVTPVFYALNYDEKNTFIGVIAAYYSAINSSSVALTLYDSRSGKKVGYFSSELGLRMY